MNLLFFVKLQRKGKSTSWYRKCTALNTTLWNGDLQHGQSKTITCATPLYMSTVKPDYTLTCVIYFAA